MEAPTLEVVNNSFRSVSIYVDGRYYGVAPHDNRKHCFRLHNIRRGAHHLQVTGRGGRPVLAEVTRQLDDAHWRLTLRRIDLAQMDLNLMLGRTYPCEDGRKAD